MKNSDFILPEDQENSQQQAQLIKQFTAVVGVESIIVEPHLKQRFEADWRQRYKGNSIAVVLPQTTQQIRQIIQLCQQHKIAIVPQGGNTSLCGASVPLDNRLPQIILNLSKLNKTLVLDIANSSITVAAGCTLKQVAEAAKEHNLYFPLSLASEGSCQIGGNIATNAGGVHVVKYGMMRDLILGLEAILPNGEIVNQLNGLRKNNTNFDLKQLFIGSEGTLGIITQAVLKLYPLPSNYCTVLLGVTNITGAIKLLQALKQQFNLSAFEIIHKLTQQIYNQHFPTQAFKVDNEWLILFELETPVEFNHESLITLLQAEKINLEQVILASNNTERRELWQMRENIPVAEKMAGFAVKHDISLPISKIEDFIYQNGRKLKNYYPEASIVVFGHLGDGNLHYNVQFLNKDLEYLQLVEPHINELVYADVNWYNGSFSAEHGIGRLKKKWWQKYSDPTSYSLAHSIKGLIDPQHIFNPGKIFDE
jgi:FAD/FMN-containing dehydrogenase